MSKVTDVNPNYKDTIDWKTLLTTIVENLHAVSHFKHETFDALQYTTDVGTVSKESLKRITKLRRGGGVEYFTYPSSYYPVPQNVMSFKDVRFMTPLPLDELSKGEEQTTKDWLKNYRPVRQRIVSSETTKDKAGTLPPAVNSNANPNATARVFIPAHQVEQTPTASSEMRSVVSDVSVSSFVSDVTAPQLTLASIANFNSDDSHDSDNDVDIESEVVIGKLIMTRSGR